MLYQFIFGMEKQPMMHTIEEYTKQIAELRAKQAAAERNSSLPQGAYQRRAESWYTDREIARLTDLIESLRSNVRKTG